MEDRAGVWVGVRVGVRVGGQARRSGTEARRMARALRMHGICTADARQVHGRCTAACPLAEV